MAAYTQFGYSYPTASQINVGQSTIASTTTGANETLPVTNPPSLSPGGSGNGTQPGALSPGSISQTSQNTGPLPVGGEGTMTSSSTCCENGRPIMTDPVTGQVICSCQYDSARLALSGYSRLPSSGVYGTSYPSSDQTPYPSIDSSAFFSPLNNPYALKDTGTSNEMSAWTSAGLQPTTGYYPYDPTLAAYGYGAGYDLASRRKNATRESTATLKAWLNEHKKNPYPTKGEKIMLAIITKMTLTQVSTWFANARRRLKKENKMTWEPKNKTDDDDDAMLSEDEKDKDDLEDKSRDNKDSMHHVKSEHDKDDDDELMDDDRKPDGIMSSNTNLQHHPYYQHSMAMLGGNHYGNHSQQHHGVKTEQDVHPKNQLESDCGVPIPASKPKIWSLADTAACKTPPLNLQQSATGWGYPNHYQHQQHHPGNSNLMMNIGGNMTHSGHPNQSMSGMMNTFASENFPYSRYTGFHDQGTPAVQHPFTSNNTNHMPITPLTPASTTPNLQQQQANPTMGFPEVLQTDTPPQTPPNMKLPNHLTSNFQPLTTNTMNNNVQTSHTSDLSAYVGNFRIQQNHHSPSSQQHGQIMVTQMQDVTGFKPFYKNNNFVSPV